MCPSKAYASSGMKLGTCYLGMDSADLREILTRTRFARDCGRIWIDLTTVHTAAPAEDEERRAFGERAQKTDMEGRPSWRCNPMMSVQPRH